MKKLIIAILCIVVIVVGFGVSGHNEMIFKREEVDTALSNLYVMLQRRADLIPNLVNTVKGFTNHETEIIEKVTDARTKLVNASNIDEKSIANNELTSALNALLVVVENYPDIKSSSNFIQLSDELAGTENRIANARRDYNTHVKDYNTLIKTFPNNILAGIFGFEERVYFEAEEGSAEVPSVNFE